MPPSDAPEPTATPAMIALDRVGRVFRRGKDQVRALDDVTLEVGVGEFVVLRGPSGCGKTTLLLAVGGMLRPSQGRVLVAGQDLYAWSGRERERFRARDVGFVFQMFHLVPYLTVLENVLLPPAPVAGADRREAARARLARLGLDHRLTHRPAELSAGERQRVALARALLNEPRLLLADEPTGNLDPDNAAEVFRHLQQFHRDGGTVLVVTHGHEADQFATRVVRLHQGRTVGSTPTA